MRSLAYLIYSVIILNCAPTLAADKLNTDRTSSDLFNLSIQDLLSIEVQSTTLTEKHQKLAPSSVTVFRKEQLKRMPISTLLDLLNYVPGFQAYRQGESASLSSYSVRGRSKLNQTQEILILVDGLRINNNNGGGGQLAAIPLADVKSVEFIRGPGSALYGSNAYLGVISITTLKGHDQNISLEYGTNQHKKLTVSWFEVIDQLTFSSALYYQEDEGESYRVPEPYTSNIIDTTDPKTKLSFKLYIDSSFGSFKFWNFDTLAEDFFIQDQVFNDVNRRNDQLQTGSYQFEYDWNSFWTSNILLSYQKNKSHVTTQLSPEGAFSSVSQPSSDDPLLAKALIEEKEWRVWLHNNLQFGETTSLQFGFEQREPELTKAILANNFDFRDIVNQSFPIRYYGNLEATTPLQTLNRRTIQGAYIQLLNKLSTNSELTLGIRKDNYSDTDNELSPRFGYVLSINNNLTVKALYGEAFRAPTSLEMYLQNNPSAIGNPLLEPERVKSSEMILMWTDESKSFSMNLFDTELEKPIETQLVNNTQTFVNGKDEFVIGYELDAIVKFDDNLRVQGNYTRLTEKPDSSISESERLATVMVDFTHSNWYFNAGYNYQSSKHMPTFDGTKKLPSFGLVDLKYGYMVSYNFDIHLQLKNIFNEKYLTPTTRVIDIEGIPNRGREIFLGFTWYQ